MIMQTNPKPALVAMDAALASNLPADGSGAIAEVHPTGLYLGGNGAIDGSVDATFDQLGGTFAVTPVIRNYDGPIVRTDLLANMLVDTTQRDAHIDALVNLAVGNLYKGIDLTTAARQEPQFNFLKAAGDGQQVARKPSQIAPSGFDTGA